MLNINPEAYQKWLQEVKIGAYCQPRMMAHRIKNLAWKWLRPSETMAEEVAEEVCIEHFVALLPLKPKRWVTCHQPRALEDAILLMEEHMSTEAGIYLKKNLQRQAARMDQAKGPHREGPSTAGALRRNGAAREPPPPPYSHPFSTGQDLQNATPEPPAPTPSFLWTPAFYIVGLLAAPNWWFPCPYIKGCCTWHTNLPWQAIWDPIKPWTGSRPGFIGWELRPKYSNVVQHAENANCTKTFDRGEDACNLCPLSMPLLNT